MTRNEAKLYIRENAGKILEPDKSKKGYVCPVCGSGTGDKGTGITTRDGIYYTCWAGCYTSADIIDIIGIRDGLTDFNAKLQRCVELFGISLDKYHSPSKKSNITSVKTQKELNFTQFFKEANANLHKTEYHRGISMATLNRFKIGYVEKWRHPKSPETVPASPRLIIPTSNFSYLARDTRDINDIPEEQHKYIKSKVGATHILNLNALDNAIQPILIVEGELDALSVIDAGGEAIATGGTSGVKKLLNILETKKPAHYLIIAMDEDDAGNKAGLALIEGLKRLDIAYLKIQIPNPYKDANELLNEDRDALIQLIKEAVKMEQSAIQANISALKKESALYAIQNLVSNIHNKVFYYPTGFINLDNLLDGGLYAGLYIVGSVTSLGKTTLCLQIADNIARQGQDTLIFSLEMAKNELIAKSISRLTAINDLKENDTLSNAKTTRGILTGAFYNSYTSIEKSLIESAVSEYSSYAEHIYITEGVGNVGIRQIKEKTERHLKITGKAPVIIVDYLQILAPNDMRATDKQNIDKAVLELKRLSRDYNVPVIGVSSFNRENYTAPVNISSYKESGAIEYSSDVLIALQYEGADYLEGEKDADRQKRIREIEKSALLQAADGQAQKIQVKVLKNRNGKKGSAFLDFYPMFNYFADRDVSTESKWVKAKSDYRN